MSFLSKILSVFKIENEQDREERITQTLIDENEELVNESLNSEIPSTVINYIPSADENSGPRMNILVDDFKARMMPDVGSIIHINDERGFMRPFKVIRFDFIANDSEYDSMRTYIVVEDASTLDLIPHPRY